MSDFNVFYPEGKKITIKGEEFSIKPFVLKNRTKAIRLFADIFVQLAKANPGMSTKVSPEDIPNLISILISAADDKLKEIYELILERQKDWLDENITLKDEFEIITAIVEVNDIPFLFSQAKNLGAKLKQTNPTISEKQ